MAEKAYDKLHTENMDYLAAMNILTEIDVTVNPLRDEKTGGQSKSAYWEQTFEFTDKSQIQLTKYQENRNFILMPSKTKIIK
jgi:hypothetical protein